MKGRKEERSILSTRDGTGYPILGFVYILLVKQWRNLGKTNTQCRERKLVHSGTPQRVSLNLSGPRLLSLAAVSRLRSKIKVISRRLVCKEILRLPYLHYRLDSVPSTTKGTSQSNRSVGGFSLFRVFSYPRYRLISGCSRAKNCLHPSLLGNLTSCCTGVFLLVEKET